MMLGKLILLIQQLQEGGNRHGNHATDRKSMQQWEIKSSVDPMKIHIPDVHWFSHLAPRDKKHPRFNNKPVSPDWI